MGERLGNTDIKYENSFTKLEVKVKQDKSYK